MTYTYHYDSPLCGITLSSNGTELTGLWFDGQKYFADTLDREREEILFQKNMKKRACRYLNSLFTGWIFISAAKHLISRRRCVCRQRLSVNPYGKLC